MRTREQRTVTQPGGTGKIETEGLRLGSRPAWGGIVRIAGRPEFPANLPIRPTGCDHLSESTAQSAHCSARDQIEVYAPQPPDQGDDHLR